MSYEMEVVDRHEYHFGSDGEMAEMTQVAVCIWPISFTNVAITIVPDAGFVLPSLYPVVYNDLSTRRNDVGFAAIVQGF